MATSASWDKFIQSEHWNELTHILKERLSRIRDALELEKDEIVLRNLQGSADQIRYMINLPNVIIDDMNNKGEV
tara:strand:- start:925 stop:1146 length:222 start_codon:yes stop_codon:yes gene_type:complete